MKQKPTQWHDWLGALLQEVLALVGLEIKVNFPITTLPPKGDVLLVRDSEKWSQAQQQYLPDGVRDHPATHIIFDLKYTESINSDAFFQIGYYVMRYRKREKLNRQAIQPFLLSASSPQPSRLNRWGYEAREYPGVYESDLSVHQLIPIISLNELRREPHNALLKCFAKSPKEREWALSVLRNLEMTPKLSIEMHQFLAGLWSP